MARGVELGSRHGYFYWTGVVAGCHLERRSNHSYPAHVRGSRLTLSLVAETTLKRAKSLGSSLFHEGSEEKTEMPKGFPGLIALVGREALGERFGGNSTIPFSTKSRK